MIRMPISRQNPIQGDFKAPASKPETQRAIVMGALTTGLTTIHHPLVARETLIMMEACRSLGAEASVLEDTLEINGIGAAFNGNLPARNRTGAHYIWAGGSALVARLFLVLGSALPGNVIIDGKCNLRVRPFEPLISALRDKGVRFRFLDDPDQLPCNAISAALPGGHYEMGTEISSQFATALLISAPLAKSPLHIKLGGPSLSVSYIRQTVGMMSRFGIQLAAEEDMTEISVSNNSSYQAREIELTGDYTSASYLLGAAFVTRGHIVVSNLDPDSLQGERMVVDIMIELGARIEWLSGKDALEVDCTQLARSVDVLFDLSDSPNILPTIAALAATVPGRVRIEGGRITQNHKSRRIDAMAAELGKAGVAVEILRDENGMVDGLEIRGQEQHEGGVEFFGHGDHRIVMAMTLFTLACRQPCSFADAVDTADSFPEFMDYFGR